jgi:hypothetical protein
MTRRDWETLVISAMVLVVTIYLATVLVYWVWGAILLYGTGALLTFLAMMRFPSLFTHLPWGHRKSVRKDRAASPLFNVPFTTMVITHGTFWTVMLCAFLFSSTTWLPSQTLLLRGGPVRGPFTAYVLRSDNSQEVLLLDTTRTVLSIPQADVVLEQPCHLKSSFSIQGLSLWALLTSDAGPKLPECPR